MKQRYNLFVMIVLVAALAAIGCGSKPEETSKVEPEVETNTKAAYETSVEQQINAIDSQIEELEAKASALSSEAKAELESMMQSLKSRKDVIAERYEAVKAASAEGWESLKASLDQAVNEFQQDYKEVMAKMQ